MPESNSNTPSTTTASALGCDTLLVLDKWETLAVRACKSNGNSIKRLRKIWAMRCGLEMNHVEDLFIADSLRLIMEKRSEGLSGKQWFSLIEQMTPAKGWEVGISEEDTYWEKFLKSLISQVRFTEIKQWPNFHTPAKFRKKING